MTMLFSSGLGLICVQETGPECSIHINLWLHVNLNPPSPINPVQIAKDAKECVQECVSEFISFITSEASERCHQEKRKTINGEDILFAMSTLGFDMYVEPLKLYLQKFREVRGSVCAPSAIAYAMLSRLVCMSSYAMHYAWALAQTQRSCYRCVFSRWKYSSIHNPSKFSMCLSLSLSLSLCRR
jgi:hypothetical protein